jgi:hypothetical protein
MCRHFLKHFNLKISICKKKWWLLSLSVVRTRIDRRNHIECKYLDPGPPLFLEGAQIRPPKFGGLKNPSNFGHDLDPPKNELDPLYA